MRYFLMFIKGLTLLLTVLETIAGLLPEKRKSKKELAHFKAVVADTQTSIGMLLVGVLHPREGPDQRLGVKEVRAIRDVLTKVYQALPSRDLTKEERTGATPVRNDLRQK